MDLLFSESAVKQKSLFLTAIKSIDKVLSVKKSIGDPLVTFIGPALLLICLMGKF